MIRSAGEPQRRSGLRRSKWSEDQYAGEQAYRARVDPLHVHSVDEFGHHLARELPQRRERTADVDQQYIFDPARAQPLEPLDDFSPRAAEQAKPHDLPSSKLSWRR